MTHADDPLADPEATAARIPGLLHVPATARNREPIRQVLAEFLPSEPCSVLEVASGSGEQGLWIARGLPQVTWTPSEATPEGVAAVAAWRALLPALHARFLAPVLLDAAAPPWPGPSVDAVFVSNLTHISPWPTTLGLMKGAAARVKPGGLLLIYGPFNEGGRFTGPGNVAFDADLKRRHPEWGLRDREAVEAAAAAEGFEATGRRMMPADNRVLAFRRRCGGVTAART
ncbi:MAG: DUF938 domain-containing protein [Rhodobacteraceae bacterium]|nr:MAG: DUF938 domain-containing protein [Paracoccaceae bacterium]